VSAQQAKPISELIKDFEQTLQGLQPSTRRVYVAGAKAAIRTAGKELSQQSSSLEERLALIRKSPPKEGARVAPFLAFLGGAAARAKGSVHKEEITALQNWVIQALGKEMRFAKNPTIAIRRDLALIAALCAAPARDTPRKWPVSRRWSGRRSRSRQLCQKRKARAKHGFSTREKEVEQNV